MMSLNPWFYALTVAILFLGCDRLGSDATSEQRMALKACAEVVASGFREIAEAREDRFLGKVEEATARCRGGERAALRRATPWVDWANYWGAGDSSSRVEGIITDSGHLSPNERGIDGALIDLEYQRIELIKFNLHDNETFEEYVKGRDGVDGRALKVWRAMRLPPEHPHYWEVGGDGEQMCQGKLMRYRTVSGICNDIRNPLMGSTGQLFARNAAFESTFPRLGRNEMARNRHGARLALLKPDPQVISRRLFSRKQTQPQGCRAGLADSADAHCDYRKAPHLNVLAAFWIQFMTHDWFSHLEEGRNRAETMAMGCATQRVKNVERLLTPGDVQRLGCRPQDKTGKTLMAADSEAGTFVHRGRRYLERAPITFRNTVTAWWDASQIYGYDARSRRRVKRDPDDEAKLLLVRQAEWPGNGERLGYLPRFETCEAPQKGAVCVPDAINPAWAGQEAAAFPDNWSIGLSFFHNLFAREHNVFVEEFRKEAERGPEADSGLRDPLEPEKIIRYEDVTPDELFEIARLVIAAEIAKIHTLEWTTQLLYNEPLRRALHANWGGLLAAETGYSRLLEYLARRFGKSKDPDKATQWYSVLASATGIFGHGSRVDRNGRWRAAATGTEDFWDLSRPDHVNGGVNHFGSPFSFSEEFVSVYRLHPMVPDLLEYREWLRDPNRIIEKIPVAETLRGTATGAMRGRGMVDWALSMGRQRGGALKLYNHPRFLQSLPLPGGGRIDVAALDLIRDRERGVPRFNEFRRQLGLEQLTSFEDFVDGRLPEESPEREAQERSVRLLREVYGQHRCDASKVITRAQLEDRRAPIDDCLGHPDGTLVDNVEDVDLLVGWLAESTRPHGFAISETQFAVFVLNASRRLFSDRFFTSSFRPEFYTHFGVRWVENNGPGERKTEKHAPGERRQQVSPLKAVLLRTIPELADELQSVVNVFDPWARDRGESYSLQWRPRPGAERDEAFREQ